MEIICASGIAGTVYSGNLRTSTVHSFYGLRTAELPSELVVDRAVSNNLVEQRVRAIDAVIWDEVSMSSRRIFELVNAIHVAFAPKCDASYLFGGKQVVLVGDFLRSALFLIILILGDLYLNLLCSRPFPIGLN